MYDKLAQFHPDSEEYQTLEYRIRSCQHYQQNAIDKAKGIESNPMPKHWFSYESNVVIDKETRQVISKDTFNLRLLANKKPYFMIYRYPQLLSAYKKYMADTSQNCRNRFGIEVEELLVKEDRSEAEEVFVTSYHNQMPVSKEKSVVNKICWKIEEHFSKRKKRSVKKEMDYQNLMSLDQKFKKKTYEAIEELYDEYKYMTQAYMQSIKSGDIHVEDDQKVSTQRELFKERFKKLANQLCSNEDELCNIIVTLCYTNTNSKQFAWDIVGETMIKNLLKRNNYVLKYPEFDVHGDIEFAGKRFSMKSRHILKNEE
ncbi:hypothetical protein GK047_19635 [Paenibacillus sp. SYP-B3998]|uniref:Uncharacterized protein n=1 Tax=Paenibacillus sp. SYP-B3998 TaxID=2678564 RepID=A0A6G4A150_9BACL|nr:hypothetical protein [Paenibacillus sp. SYP-B3998]NEW08216.1 hypothetical protein [Paenibacillus sp. SYP-B3998]